MKGSELRRYRTLANLTQSDCAQALEVTQPTLSHMESGRIAISGEHIARLRKAFDQPSYQPRFSDFLRELDQAKKAKRGALMGSLSRHHTLCVWRSDAFDLSRPPEIDQAAGLVAVRSDTAELVALQMSRKTKYWMRDEIIVFAECHPSEVNGTDLCLVQTQKDKSETQTVVAAVGSKSTSKGDVAQFNPVASTGHSILVGAEEVIACFRAVFRGRYL